jgi:choline dehydrogenase-like flavoprotein
MTQYDIITIGGGLGGAPLAKAMAERGARVLVLEREMSSRTACAARG